MDLTIYKLQQSIHYSTIMMDILNHLKTEAKPIIEMSLCIKYTSDNGQCPDHILLYFHQK